VRQREEDIGAMLRPRHGAIVAEEAG
jgi:hypothetical protein